MKENPLRPLNYVTAACLILVFSYSIDGQKAPVREAERITRENAGKLRVIAELRYSPWELVLAAAWSMDGRLVAASVGEQVKLIEAWTWKELAYYPLAAFTNSLAFSPDGNWFAAGSRDGALRLWRLEGGGKEFQEGLTIPAHRKGVTGVAFNPVGESLASGGIDGVARFWDMSSGKMTGLAIGGSFAVPAIAFSPDGKTLAMVNGGIVRLRETGTERILGTLRVEGALYSVAFSPDGKLLAAGDIENHVLIWNPAMAFRTGRERYPTPQILSGHSGKPGTFRSLVWAVIFNPEGELLASAGGDGTVRLWEMPEGKLLMTLDAHPAGATCVAFSPDGRILISGGLDGVLRIWGIVN